MERNEFMANGTIHRLGTLKVDGTVRSMPTNPVSGGDCVSYNGTAISIENTVSGKELQWIEWTKSDGTKLLVCDRCLVVNITWNNLDAASLIFGKEITIDNQKYKVRSLTGSTGASGTYGTGCNNEWDQFLDAVGESNNLVHWQNMYTWCQETYYNNSSSRSLRGCSGARYYDYYNATNYNYRVGFRPALEILNSAPKISPASKGFGEVTTAPTLTLSITEPESESFTGVVKLDGTQKETFSGTASKVYTVPISTWWPALSKAQHTIQVVVTDSNGNATTNTYTFTKTNSTPAKPTISTPTGGMRRGSEFYVQFKCGADADGDTQVPKVQISSESTFATVTEITAFEMRKNGVWAAATEVTNANVGNDLRAKVTGQTAGTKKYIRIASTDSGSGGVVYSDACQVKIGNVLEIISPVEQRTERPATIRVIYKGVIDAGATTEIFVTNNANDASPTWEEYTGDKHTFANETETADRWATAVRIKITANDATGEISISAIGTGVV